MTKPGAVPGQGTGSAPERSGRAAADPRFFAAALEAVLEVLPVSRTWTGIDLEGEKAAAGDDSEALWNLARLAWRDRIDEPEQLGFWVRQTDA